MKRPQVLCPRCTGVLAGARCTACDVDYQGPLGIIDLAPLESLDATTQELVERAGTASIAELLTWYQPSLRAGRTAEVADLNVWYATTAVERSERMLSMFSGTAEDHTGRPLGGDVALDLGCGMGGALVGLAKRFDHVIGIDLSFPKLLCAACQVRDSGLDNVTLVHGAAGGLPFADQSVDAIVALNVLEHLVDHIDDVLGEVGRILARGGVFCGDSRNRYDLLLIEPHARLRLVGMLPRPAQVPYVKWRTGRNYAGVRLLSAREVHGKLTRHVGPTIVRMGTPSVWGRSHRADGVVAAVDRVPVLGPLARSIYPSLVVAAQRA